MDSFSSFKIINTPKKKWYKEPSNIITLIIGLLTVGSPIFLGLSNGEIKNQNKVVVSDSSIKSSAILQNSPNAVVQISADASDKENEQVLNRSIFDILTEAKQEKTTLARDDFFNKYINLKIRDRGYIIDIRRPQLFTQGEDPYYEVILGRDIPHSHPLWSATTVECHFKKEWFKLLEALDPTKEIRFEGIVSRKALIFLSAFFDPYLNSCRLLEN